ncbi:MAG: peptidoglycan DD-metalloendopeptidase family protein [Gammaproteobacteria bacterium]|nr:peptidoglycan DD-metalloendopeptidase family protein [Gammaproteobacteria bacterium]MCW8922019.1 peptidoglycan DD-metalloendopeptidase family protein [Gammaproteobacteria bacterium]
MIFLKRLFFSSLLTASFLLNQPVTAYAEDEADLPAYQQKLDRLQQSILKIQAHLKDTRSHRGHTLTELQKLESEISRNARALKKTEKKINTITSHISELKKNLDILSKRLKKQKFILSEQLRAAYALGAQQNMKMLLNQQDPAEMGRIQAYFNYLNRAREVEIQEFIKSIESKQQQEQELSQSLITQKEALATRKSQKRSLQKQRLKRNQLLTQLNKKIEDQEQTLTGLESSRNKIEDLLRSLGQLLADIPSAPGDRLPFKQRKGLLPWPIKGPFLARYGQSRNKGDLNWNGVLIGSPYGTPVRTVSHGRVAFSDWLQGYGFIIIIDHGDGYMSLYGHNESLFKQAGDWVTSGEVIATTGDSGGQPQPGLYFEIRESGKPIDPYSWCSKKAQHHASR